MSSVGENFFGGTEGSQPFVLSGAGITSVTITANGFNSAAIASAPLDNFNLTQAPEPSSAIFPIATNSAFVEFGISAAFDGSNYLVGIQGDAVAHDSVTAQLISSNGSLVGPKISTGEFGGVPRVLFDGTNYFMFWDGAGSNPGVHGQFVSKAGALVGSLLTITSTDTSEISIAYGGGKHLTCWSDGNTVSGRVVTPAGTFSGVSFAISGATQRARENAVAFGGTNFLVVFNGSGDHRTNIYGQFVSPSGTLVGSTFLVDDSSDPSDNPLGVAFDGTNYLVTFNDEVGGVDTGAWQIFGRLITSAGSVLGSRLNIATNTEAHRFPSPVFDGSNYLVSWNDASGATNMNQVYRFFSPAGQPIGPEFSVLAPQGANRPLFVSPLFDGNRFLVVGTIATLRNGFNFASGDVYGAFLPKSSAAPRLEAAGPRIGSQFPLLLTGTPGINYVVQTLTNLNATNWTTLITNSPTNGTFNFTDTAATNASRFYRAVKQ